MIWPHSPLPFPSFTLLQSTHSLAAAKTCQASFLPRISELAAPPDTGRVNSLTFSNLCCNVTFSMTPSLTTLFKIVISHRLMKRCSILLIIREMQIKTTMRYHLTAIRMAIIKSLQITNVYEDVEKREPLYTVGGNINWCSYCGKQFGGFSKN